MHHIKTGISVREIMDRKFPIIDITMPLVTCVKKMNHRHEACLVIDNGNFRGILGFDDILRGFMYGQDRNAKIDKMSVNKKYAIVEPDSDVYQSLLLMKEDDIDFILVKDSEKFLGLVTKKEIANIEPELFENFKITT